MSEQELKQKEETGQEKMNEEAVVETENTEEETGQEEKVKKEKVSKDEKAGIAYVFGSFNNTIVHVTDMAGNTIARVSGGMVTKHSRLKANPTTAMFVAKRVAERVKDVGITALYVRTRGQTRAPGTGPGAHSAVKTLGKEGIRLISIVDTTRVPRGGPKKKGGKRGRRV